MQGGVDRDGLIHESTHGRSAGDRGETEVVEERVRSRGARVFSGDGEAELPRLSMVAAAYPA